MEILKDLIYHPKNKGFYQNLVKNIKIVSCKVNFKHKTGPCSTMKVT